MRRRDREAPTLASALIQEARRRTDLTQAQLASRASVSQQTISRIERGDSDPGLRQLNNILRPAGFELKVSLTHYEEPEPMRVEIDLRERESRAAQAEAEARMRAI